MNTDIKTHLANDLEQPGCDHDWKYIGSKRQAMWECTKCGMYKVPDAPPECQTEAEKKAYAFGWYKALESVREQPAQKEPVAWAKDTGKKLRITHMNMEGDDGWRPLVYGDTTPPAPAGYTKKIESLIAERDALKAKLAEQPAPAQEPDIQDWMKPDALCDRSCLYACTEGFTKFPTCVPPTSPTQEPDPNELTIAYMSGLYEGKKRKPWVGLTDEEIDDIEATWEATQEWVSFSHATRVIEAKLKEKNT